MRFPARLAVSGMAAACTLAVLSTNPALAQDKLKEDVALAAAQVEKGKPVTKVLFEDDRVLVTEKTYKPGDASNERTRPYRVVNARKGGTFQRIFADGTTEKVVWKDGEVRSHEADVKAFSLKNVGDSDIVIFVVYLKEPRK